MLQNPDLKAEREALLEDEAAERGITKKDEKVERVLKLFTPAEKADAIRANPVTVKVSVTEPRDVKILPLNVMGMIKAYKLIRAILIPVLAKFGAGQTVTLDQILEALGEEQADQIPDLLLLILQRGNQISKDWIIEHLDTLDCQVIFPVFVEQNGLEKLLGGLSASVGRMPKPDALNGQPPLRMVESSASSPSSADGTAGTPKPSGTN
jgi:hypothetical protein